MEESGQRRRRRRPWRQEARRKAVLGARRRLGRQDARWGGRLGRQETRRQAVFGARKLLDGRLGRQDARWGGRLDSSGEKYRFVHFAGRAQAADREQELCEVKEVVIM